LSNLVEKETNKEADLGESGSLFFDRGNGNDDE